uniref:THAP-type domain-containing protein n=1 Tax=Ixodes ricinus TaxID=34613 RepID=A0A0K8R627_IXORI
MLRTELPHRFCIPKLHVRQCLHKFLEGQRDRDQWLAAIPAEQLWAPRTVDATQSICSLHFVESDYIEFAGVKVGIPYHLVQRLFINNICFFP